VGARRDVRGREVEDASARSLKECKVGESRRTNETGKFSRPGPVGSQGKSRCQHEHNTAKKKEPCRVAQEEQKRGGSACKDLQKEVRRTYGFSTFL